MFDAYQVELMPRPRCIVHLKQIYKSLAIDLALIYNSSADFAGADACSLARSLPLAPHHPSPPVPLTCAPRSQAKHPHLYGCN